MKRITSQLLAVPMLALLLVSASCMSTVRNHALQFVSGDGPVYPKQAQAQGLEGYVVVEYAVSATGKVTSPRVMEAQPLHIFDQAALAAVAGWKYRPQVKQGVFIETPRVRSKLTFKLSSRSYYPKP